MHISSLSNKFVEDPHTVVKAGDIVVVHFGNDTVKIKILATPDVANKANATDLYEVIDD